MPRRRPALAANQARLDVVDFTKQSLIFRDAPSLYVEIETSLAPTLSQGLGRG